MSNNKVSFWNSIIIRFAILFTLLVILCVLISGYLAFNQASSIILEHGKENISHDAQLAKQSFYNLLKEVSNDIAVVTNNPTVELYITDATPFNTEQTDKLAEVLLSNKPEYFQLRILDVNDGNEIIRFNKSNDSITKTPEDQLQNKGDKEYFTNAISRPEIAYYFSEINLNEEFGKVSSPIIPTLRAVGKIYDQHKKLSGLLVINIDLSSFFSGLDQIMQSDSKLIITDTMGEYLFEPNPAKRFGKQLNIQASFPNDYPIKWKQLTAQDNSVEIMDNQNNRYLCQVDKLSYSQEQQQIYLLTLLSVDLLLKDAESVRLESLKKILIICSIALLFVFTFAWLLSRSINQITHAISNLDGVDNLNPNATLPENRKDEVGLLARSFSKMKTRIDQQVLELKGALKREQEAIAQRDEFFQNMSHELRTPLNAILGLTQLLNKNKRTPQQQPIIDSLNRSTTNLTGLMHDILDQEKLLEGRVKLKKSTSNPHLLLYDIYTSYQYEAINKGLTFNFEVEDELKNQFFSIDPLRFNQIVTNLVINAIKYTEKGIVTLSAKLKKEKNKNLTKLTITVSDTGEGISPENLNHIKERFYQALNGKTHKVDGFGLGLSIVKQLVDLFGGNLTVASELGIGSQFSFTFPIQTVSNQKTQSKYSSSEIRYPKFKNEYRILHIEDDDSSLLLVRNTFDLPYISLTQTKEFEKAIAITSEIHPHLILSDLMLDGEVIKDKMKVNLIDQTNIPFVILSAFDQDSEDTISPYYLQKPIDLDQLKDQVIILLGGIEFDIPHLISTYEQYDHKKDKIINYLSILISEFDTYISRIEKATLKQDEKEWKSIMHKLITHIKGLRLEKLANILPEDVSKMNLERSQLVVNHILFHLCYFRNELRINSAD